MTPAVVLVAAFLATAGPPDAWELRNPPTTARLRGLSAVDSRVVWASGTGGTYVKTADGGKSWKAGQVPGAGALDFRDIEAFDERTALLLSSGPGDQSRVYRTADGGQTWELRFTNPDADGFLDALAFWDAERGIAFGDPVGGRFRTFLTVDGGKNWRPGPESGMPPALPGEGAFAASGTCLVALPGTRTAWFATGGARAARVFRTDDGGTSWAAAETPVPAGNPSSGIFSVAFRDDKEGLAIGGDYKAPDAAGRWLARTADGGKTWVAVENGPKGYRSAVAYLSDPPSTVIAVGPGGGDISRDGGRTWSPLSDQGFHAMSGRGGGWAVGDDGRVGRLVFGSRN